MVCFKKIKLKNLTRIQFRPLANVVAMLGGVTTDYINSELNLQRQIMWGNNSSRQWWTLGQNLFGPTRSMLVSLVLRIRNPKVNLYSAQFVIAALAAHKIYTYIHLQPMKPQSRDFGIHKRIGIPGIQDPRISRWMPYSVFAFIALRSFYKM